MDGPKMARLGSSAACSDAFAEGIYRIDIDWLRIRTKEDISREKERITDQIFISMKSIDKLLQTKVLKQPSPSFRWPSQYVDPTRHFI